MRKGVHGIVMGTDDRQLCLLSQKGRRDERRREKRIEQELDQYVLLVRYI